MPDSGNTDRRGKLSTSFWPVCLMAVCRCEDWYNRCDSGPLGGRGLRSSTSVYAAPTRLGNLSLTLKQAGFLEKAFLRAGTAGASNYHPRVRTPLLGGL